MTLGRKIKVLRAENKMTQGELAKILKVAVSTLSHYEINNREPNFETLKELSKIFDVSIDWLLGVVEDRHTIISKHTEPPERYKKILDSMGVEDIGIFEDAEMTDEDWLEVIAFVKKFKTKSTI